VIGGGEGELLAEAELTRGLAHRSFGRDVHGIWLESMGEIGKARKRMERETNLRIRWAWDTAKAVRADSLDDMTSHSTSAVRLSTQSPSLQYRTPPIDRISALWMCPHTTPSTPRRRASCAKAISKSVM